MVMVVVVVVVHGYLDLEVGKKKCSSSVTVGSRSSSISRGKISRKVKNRMGKFVFLSLSTLAASSWLVANLPSTYSYRKSLKNIPSFEFLSSKVIFWYLTHEKLIKDILEALQRLLCDEKALYRWYCLTQVGGQFSKDRIWWKNNQKYL